MSDIKPEDSVAEYQVIEPPSKIAMNYEGKTLLTILADGTIVRGEAFTTTDEASLHFWDVVSQCFPEWRARLIAEPVREAC